MEEQKNVSVEEKVIVKKEKKAAPKKESMESTVVSILESFSKKLEEVVARVDAISEKGSTQQVVEKLDQIPAQPEKSNRIGGGEGEEFNFRRVNTAMPTGPLPSAYEIEEVLENTFGKEHGFLYKIDQISGETSTPRGYFQFTIIVPEKFLDKGETNRERSRVLPVAFGIEGVKEWVGKVRQNLVRFFNQSIG